MKRTTFKLILLTALAMLVFSTGIFAQQPKSASTETINVIKLLEIANGDDNGNMNYDKNVSRAEFVKMAISASTSKDLAANIKLNISLFPDVKNSYWGAGYISVAINNGLVTGYIDGTFKPGNPVSLEEAATIVLRLLGYSDSDFVGSYPMAQLQKYKDLKLDENITAVRGDKLTREQCMILLYNALSAKTKQGSVYCTSLGYTANSDGKLDYSALLEQKLDGPIIVGDVNNLFASTSFKENNNTVYVINNVISKKSDISVNDVVYYSDIINSVYAYRKTATGIVSGTNSSTVQLASKSYVIATASAKDKLSLGGKYSEEKSFVTLILGINDGVVDVIDGSLEKLNENADNSSHISMIDQTMSKPVYISSQQMAQNWKSYIPFDTENASIYFNSNKVQNADVNANDVIYYSKQFSSVWIYRKTISGKVEAISPASAPTSVTVAGKTYSIASSDAEYDFSIYGQYEVGDKVTLILGINDECVAAVDTAIASSLIYGVVTDLGTKQYIDRDGESYTADYVTVTDTKTNVYTYEFENRYLTVGDGVKVTVGDKVTITKTYRDIGRSAAIQLSDAIKNGNFSKDCEIIDAKGKNVIKVNPERLSGTQIDTDQFTVTKVVLYWEFDSDKNISKLILNDFTGDIDEYGVVVSATENSVRYMTDSNVQTLSIEGNAPAVGAMRLDNGVIHPMRNYIDNIVSVSNIAVYDEDEKEYLLSDDVKVFLRTTTGYDSIKLSDIMASEYTLRAYYDRAQKYGGRIRVIIAIRQ